MNETAIRETESEEGTFLHANNIDDALYACFCLLHCVLLQISWSLPIIFYILCDPTVGKDGSKLSIRFQKLLRYKTQLQSPAMVTIYESLLKSITFQISVSTHFMQLLQYKETGNLKLRLW